MLTSLAAFSRTPQWIVSLSVFAKKNSLAAAEKQFFKSGFLLHIDTLLAPSEAPLKYLGCAVCSFA